MPANDFYSATGAPSTRSPGSSATIRAEFAAIQAGFSKLPTLTGNGGKLVAINQSGSAMQHVSKLSIDANGNLTAGGNVTVNGVLKHGTATVWDSANLTNLSQLTNGPGYITGITSGMVTTALGYTPYNSTNPNGYITSAALASYATLASPALTGAPTAPTAAADTNTTQLATTAFVVGQAASATSPMNGAAAVGTSLRYARQDHVHPTDTTRAPLASPAFTGTPTAPTAATGTNTTQIATTAYVVRDFLALSGGTMTGTLSSAAASAFRINNDGGFFSGHDSAGTTRTGYLQFNAGVSIRLNADSAIPIIFRVANTEAFRVDSNGVGKFSAGAYTAVKSVAFSATPTFDCTDSNQFELGALTGNVTSMTISNASAGQTISIRVAQDATGGRTVAVPTGAKIDGSIATGANRVSYLTMTYSSAGARWEGNWFQVPA